MARTVQRILAKVFSVVLLLVGLGALFGGNFAHNYVSDQLKQEKITMPADAQLTTQEMKDALGKYAGKEMTTGPQAEAFANDYLWEHMMSASGGKTYEEVSGAYNKMTDEQKASGEGQKLGGLRQTMFMGDALRSMLLTAYAFWLVGTIAMWAGIACILLGLLLGLLGWFLWKNKDGADDDLSTARPAHDTTTRSGSTVA